MNYLVGILIIAIGTKIFISLINLNLTFNCNNEANYLKTKIILETTYQKGAIKNFSTTKCINNYYSTSKKNRNFKLKKNLNTIYEVKIKSPGKL